ncbi:hypothetical protein A3A93_06250 [Candidatus Roizmanbacteria bacterium RIFCSPLOWO2_01_FULL_38_12]|uniref:PDZ domain-containing protein n=1 Tax=Candidatus Roizmanbacteria bacterium RIFCSPLOWO2_01_FULL_38_12 TaxID=1802061 RepID=A0A1F7IU19_9BACT|nr:MAG: hypothetical protein A2861_02020 [Candidatus Roizmanbacteria bacterium RIFCSPHIGHO2_01_FULL_38_15]OGK34846.1 MAG: hypothetical protein A3F59_00565 [Candidatus Roizmanbacteria bacterium RIFCSPHIGHO2_12_FULL_38_13]OGK46831.1 MAG: hypothetical protein A3A93_06250 [Candidatus Roizmanbacteria bacterium RIFCSPLOWO2_01_FULL_38_12]
MRLNKITNYLLYAAIAVLLFGSGYKYAEWDIKQNARELYTHTVFNANAPAIKNDDGKNIDFSLFWETWEKVEQKYIDDTKLDPQKMFYGSIKGMVAALGDPYTFFMTPEENKQSKDELGGKFEGIGAQLGLKNNQVVVIAPLKNSPAETAGLRTGDIITQVDGESTKDWTLVQTVSKIRGEKGTKVTLTINRSGAEKTIAITRNEINVPSIELTFESNNGKSVAYLKLNQFGDNTNEEWDKAINDIANRWKNSQIAGMILDVRSNPGGYLEGAVYIGSEFLDKGKVIVTQEMTDTDNMVYTVKRNGKLLDIPLVVLIDQGSASASEILSGALRDYGRAKLVGMKSFGKGSVQEAVDLSAGAGLHVTIAKWILPNGDWINGTGIKPDIEIENTIEDGNTITSDNDKQLKTAIQELTK